MEDLGYDVIGDNLEVRVRPEYLTLIDFADLRAGDLVKCTLPGEHKSVGRYQYPGQEYWTYRHINSIQGGFASGTWMRDRRDCGGCAIPAERVQNGNWKLERVHPDVAARVIEYLTTEHQRYFASRSPDRVIHL